MDKTTKLPKIHLTKALVWDYAKMVLGSAALAVGVAVFFDPYGIAQGGVNGISIILKFLGEKIDIHLTLSVLNIVFNLPLLIAGWFILGRTVIVRTIISTALTSFFLWLCEMIPFFETDIFLASAYGGILSGIGVGLVISAKGTTGGSDLVACMLQHTRYKHISVMNILFVLDGIVIILGAFVFGYVNALYALLSIYVTSKVGDIIMAGGHGSQAVYVISEKWEEITQELLKLDRGVTGIESTGMFSGAKRKMLYCVASSREIPKIKGIIYASDPRAFVVVSNVVETIGEGFSEYES